MDTFNAFSYLNDLLSEEGTAGYLSFDELIRTADVISVHVPYSAETHHLLSDAQFDQMKDGVFLVNTARGAGELSLLHRVRQTTTND